MRAVTPVGQELASGKQEGNVSQQVDTNCWMCWCGTVVQDNVTSRLPVYKDRGCSSASLQKRKSETARNCRGRCIC